VEELIVFCVVCRDQEPSGSNWYAWTWMPGSLGPKPCCWPNCYQVCCHSA